MAVVRKKRGELMEMFKTRINRAWKLVRGGSETGCGMGYEDRDLEKWWWALPSPNRNAKKKRWLVGKRL